MSDSSLDRLLAGLHPSERALRQWVAPQLDPSMVEEIAAADYGMLVAEYRDAVEELIRSPWLPDPIGRAEDVLALTRWHTVDSSDPNPRRSHLIRLFCCLFLIRATTNGDRPTDSLAPLVESAVELGPEASEPAASFLAWCRLNEPGDWRDRPAFRPVLTLSLVILSAVRPAGRDPDLVPGLVAAFVEEMSEVLAEENLAWSTRPVHELLKLTSQAGSRRLWVSMATRYLVDEPLLAQVIRGDIAADTAELRPLLLPHPPSNTP